MTSEVVISHPRSPSEFQSPAAGRWDGLQAGHKCHVCISTYTWINLCPISWETWLSCQLVHHLPIRQQLKETGVKD